MLIVGFSVLLISAISQHSWERGSELTCFCPSLSLLLCVYQVYKSSNWIWCRELLKHWWICLTYKRNIITNTGEISVATDEPVTFLTEEAALILVCLSEFAYSQSQARVIKNIQLCVWRYFYSQPNVTLPLHRQSFSFLNATSWLVMSLYLNNGNGIMNLEIELWTEKYRNCDAKGICIEIDWSF